MPGTGSDICLISVTVLGNSGLLATMERYLERVGSEDTEESIKKNRYLKIVKGAPVDIINLLFPGVYESFASI